MIPMMESVPPDQNRCNQRGLPLWIIHDEEIEVGIGSRASGTKIDYVHLIPDETRWE